MFKKNFKPTNAQFSRPLVISAFNTDALLFRI